MLLWQGHLLLEVALLALVEIMGLPAADQALQASLLVVLLPMLLLVIPSSKLPLQHVRAVSAQQALEGQGRQRRALQGLQVTFHLCWYRMNSSGHISPSSSSKDSSSPSSRNTSTSSGNLARGTVLAKLGMGRIPHSRHNTCVQILNVEWLHHLYLLAHTVRPLGRVRQCRRCSNQEARLQAVAIQVVVEVYSQLELLQRHG